MEENKIIKNNAISAYLLFWISWTFLFIRKKEEINNNFVKNHTKSALLIHFFMILDFFIFRYYKIFSSINFYEIYINSIIFFSILWGLFLILFWWIYKAYKWEYFKIWEILKIKSDKNLLDIDKNWNFEEKDKVTFILAFIPFLGQIFTSKYNKNENIKEILKLNTLVSFIFCLLFINNYSNLNQILNLIYAIFIAFCGVSLFVKSELITINIPKFLSFSEIFKNTKILLKYIKNYIYGNFVEYKILLEEKNKKIFDDEKNTYEKMKTLPELKWPKKIIYLPIINLYFAFFKENSHQIHIRNWLTISILFILCLILIFLKIFSIKILVLFLFPICFWIWNLWKNYYKIPLIYDIYETYSNTIDFFKKTKKFISEKKKEKKEVTLKVWENKNKEKTENEK